MKRKTITDRSKRRNRVALRVAELSDDELTALAAAEVPMQYAPLDEELSSGPDVCHARPLIEPDAHPRDGGQIWSAHDYDALVPQIEKLFKEGDER